MIETIQKDKRARSNELISFFISSCTTPFFAVSFAAAAS